MPFERANVENELRKRLVNPPGLPYKMMGVLIVFFFEGRGGIKNVLLIPLRVLSLK